MYAKSTYYCLFSHFPKTLESETGKKWVKSAKGLLYMWLRLVCGNLRHSLFHLVEGDVNLWYESMNGDWEIITWNPLTICLYEQDNLSPAQPILIDITKIQRQMEYFQ